MSYLAAVTHDIKSNTLEATWLEDTGTELRRVKCQNYSPSQAKMFTADIGDETASKRYLDAAGWTDELCTAYTAEEVRQAEEARLKANAESVLQAQTKQAEFDAKVQEQVAIILAAQAQIAGQA